MNTRQNTQGMQELLQQQSNAGKEQNRENSSSELIERKDIEGTPFTMINQGNGWMLTMGMYKLTKEGHTEKELQALVKKPTWDLQMGVMSAVAETMIKIKAEESLKEWSETNLNK